MSSALVVFVLCTQLDQILFFFLPRRELGEKEGEEEQRRRKVTFDKGEHSRKVTSHLHSILP